MNFDDSKNSAMKIEDPYETQTKNIKILPALQNSIMNRFRNKSTAMGNTSGSFDFRIRSSSGATKIPKKEMNITEVFVSIDSLV